MIETKRTWSIEAGERVKIVAPTSARLGQRATVISPHTGEFVMICFDDGATGCWHAGELEVVEE